jgi:hypothetical protein
MVRATHGLYFWRCNSNGSFGDVQPSVVAMNERDKWLLLPLPPYYDHTTSPSDNGNDDNHEHKESLGSNDEKRYGRISAYENRTDDQWEATEGEIQLLTISPQPNGNEFIERWSLVTEQKQFNTHNNLQILANPFVHLPKRKGMLSPLCGSLHL